MNSKRSRSLFLGSLALTMAIFCHAGQGVAQTKVALIDVGAIFKNHPRFSQELATLKAEAEKFQAKSNEIRQSMMVKAEELSQFTPGSPDYKQLESKLAQEAAAIEVEQKNEMRNMMIREARLHFETYQEVTAVIQNYCLENGIQLVVRYNSTPMDPSQPNSIMQKVNGNVVYHSPNKDVTQVIAQRIAQMSASAAQDPTHRR